MTLLGSFQMGTSSNPAEPATMNMSLDELIESRRKAANASKAKQAIQKDVSNVDRSVATSRAKRNAAMNARRGLATTNKASAMDVEKEVKKQVAKSTQQHAAQLKKNEAQKKQTPVSAGPRLTPQEKAAARREKRRIRKEAGAAAAAGISVMGGAKGDVVTLTRPPSKKAVKAAVEAMRSTGFTVPEGMQMVISFAPLAAGAQKHGAGGGGGGGGARGNQTGHNPSNKRASKKKRASGGGGAGGSGNTNTQNQQPQK